MNRCTRKKWIVACALVVSYGTFSASAQADWPQCTRSVVGHWIFFNNSFYDTPSTGAQGCNTLFGGGAPCNDNSARSPNITTLLPGQTVTVPVTAPHGVVTNHSNYTKGINGIMIDLTYTGGAGCALPAGTLTAPQVASTLEFIESSGRGVTSAYTGANRTATATVSIAPHPTLASTDRVTIIFPDNTSTNARWLRTRLLTGGVVPNLAGEDKFYFGLQKADGYSPANGFAVVTCRDQLHPKPPNTHNTFARAPINESYDYDHNSIVDETDVALASENAASSSVCLQLTGVSPFAPEETYEAASEYGVTIKGLTSTLVPLPPDNQSSATLTLTTDPALPEPVVQWEIIGDDYGCSLSNSTTPTATIGDCERIPPDKKKLEIKVTVFADEYTDCSERSFFLDISCGGATCTGNCGIGEGAASNGSVSFSVALGTTADGNSAGRLYIDESEPSDAMYTPETLRHSVGPASVVEIEQNGSLRQVKAPQGLADIVPHTSGYKYTIAIYLTSQVTGFSNGLYTFTGNPIVRWVIGHPDLIANDNAPPPTDNTQLTVVKQSPDGASTLERYDYVYTAGSTAIWSLATRDPAQSGAPVVRLETKSSTNIGSDDREEIQTIRKNSSSPIEQEIRRIYHTYAWGEELTQETINPSGANLTTDWTYGAAGRIDTIRNPDGSWVNYVYSGTRLTQEFRPWLDSGPTTTPSQARTIEYEYEYEGHPPGDTVSSSDTRPRRVTESVLGTAIARTYHAYFTVWVERTPPSASGYSLREVEKRCVTATAAYDADTNLTTTTTYTDTTGSRVERVESYDGRLDVYTYEPSGYGGLRTLVKHTTIAIPDGTSLKSTADATETDGVGLVRLQQKSVYNAGTWQPIESTYYTYNERGQVTQVTNPNGTFSQSGWGCCHKDSETDETGIHTTYDLYDPMGNLLRMTREGFGIQPDNIVTTYTYDAVGRQLTATRSSGTLAPLTSTTDYDGAGRIHETTDEAALVAGYAYSPGSQSQGHTVTVTRPGGAIEETAYYRDGRVKSVTGTGVVAKYYHYWADAMGLQWTQVLQGVDNPAQTPFRTETAVNAVGQTVHEIEYQDTMSGDPLQKRHYYNLRGQLVRTETCTNAGLYMADTLYEYDEATGELWRSGLDLPPYSAVDGEGNYHLVDASRDRITQTESKYESDASGWWLKTTATIFPVLNSDDAIEVSTNKRRVSGFANGITEEAIAIDANGNQTVTTVVTDRPNRLVTRTIDVPDSIMNEQTISENGLIMSSIGRTANLMTYGYDALGRQTAVTDPRTGTSHTDYNDIGQVEASKDPEDRTTTYAYDGVTGQLMSLTNPLGKKQYFAYTIRGETEMTWGETPYPVKYGYDAFGRRTSITTYQNNDFTQPEWPANAVGDTTLFIYGTAQNPSRFMTRKEYADGKATNYTYKPDGKVATRTWARDGGSLVTTYSYDSLTGELTWIDYPGGTPDVTFTYDRLGRQETVTDAVGTRTFSYRDNPSDIHDLQLESEDIVASSNADAPSYSKLITRKYQVNSISTEMTGRTSGFQIGASPNLDYDSTYVYTVHGRIAQIRGPGLAAAGVWYDYTVHSDLVWMAKYRLIMSTMASATFAYEPYRDLVASVENKREAAPAETLSKYAYLNDDAGRRTSVVMTGMALGSDHHWRWGYNDRSELYAAQRCEGVNPDPETMCSMMTPGIYTYGYDPIGNRTQTSQDGWSNFYCTNVLNQYTATRGFGDSCPNPAFPRQSFMYDEDGNLIFDGQTMYFWDAENRLTVTVPGYPVDGSQAVVYDYDYMSRRVRKQVYTFQLGTGNWQLETDLRFVYDQWNVVLVLDGLDHDANGQPDNTILTKYTWGLDLSGQRGNPSAGGIHGAGGIGGLLAAQEMTGTYAGSYWFLYDANGNVSEVVQNTTNYPVVAHYEYDAYGNLLTSPTGYAAANPFRFSTKWRDAETGLYYYGYRYYNSALGRWLNRDPIEEAGGLNLFVFDLNAPLHRFDPYGLRFWEKVNDWFLYLTGGSSRWEQDRKAVQTTSRVIMVVGAGPGVAAAAVVTAAPACALSVTLITPISQLGAAAGGTAAAVTAGTPVVQRMLEAGTPVVGFLNRLTGQVYYATRMIDHTSLFAKLQELGKIPQNVNLNDWIGFTILRANQINSVIGSGSAPGFQPSMGDVILRACGL